MEGYPDPTLPSRPPHYPYFLDFVATPASSELYQNDNSVPSQLSGSSQHQEKNLEHDVLRAEATERPLRALSGIAAAYDMPPPAIPLLKKRRRQPLGDAPPKRQRLPVVGIFRTLQPPTTRARSPLRAIKNTQNANFTAKDQENDLATLAKHTNTREQTKSTIIYKENRQGRLVIQKYSHQRTGSATKVRDKQGSIHKPPSASQDQNQDQRLIQSLAFPVPPPPQASGSPKPGSHNYLHNLYRAFKRDFEDSSLLQTNYLRETINPQDLDLSMENHNRREKEMEYYFDGHAPPPSNPLQHNVIRPQHNQQQRADTCQPSQQHVALAHIINRGEDRGLASRSNYDASVPTCVSKHNRTGHGVREFVELMNHEGRDDANHNHDIAMTSPLFADPPLAERDTIPDESRASSGSLGTASDAVGASVPDTSAEDGGQDDSSSIPNETRASSPFLGQGHLGNDNGNPFAFASGEHLAHPRLFHPRWDGRDLTGFPVHLPDHSPEAQQAIWSAYT